MRLNLDLDQAVHRELKRLALDEDRSVADLVRELIQQAGKDHGETPKEPTVKITLELPVSLHRKLRQRVLDDDTDASKYLRQLLEQDMTDAMELRDSAKVGDEEVTTLYRVYDAERRLLYVGISSSSRVEQRFDLHERTARWWGKAASVDLNDFPSRSEAAAAELRAIRTEQPIYNEAAAAVAEVPKDLNQRFTVWLPRALVAEIKAAAAGKGESIASLVTRAIGAEIDHDDSTPSGATRRKTSASIGSVRSQAVERQV